MSHFTKVTTQIKDLKALEKALQKMNLKLTQNTQCRYFYGSVLKENVIKLPKPCPYDVAIEEQTDGTYDIDADFYNGHVEQVIGPKGETLLKQYAIEKLKIEAKKHGYKVYEKGNGIFKIIDTKTNGKVEVECLPNGQMEIKTSGFKGKSCMKFHEIEKALGNINEIKKTSEYYQEDRQKEKLLEWS